METWLLFIFDEIWPNSLYYIVQPVFEQLKKFIKNPTLIGISSKFLHSIRTCTHIRKNYKNGELAPFILDEIWPNSLYYSTGSLVLFLSNFKNS